MSTSARNQQYLSRSIKPAPTKHLKKCPVCGRMIAVRSMDGKFIKHGPNASPCSSYEGPMPGTTSWKKAQQL